MKDGEHLAFTNCNECIKFLSTRFWNIVIRSTFWRECKINSILPSLEFSNNLITQKLSPNLWIVCSDFFLLISNIHYIGSFYLAIAHFVVEHINNCNLAIFHIVVLAKNYLVLTVGSLSQHYVTCFLSPEAYVYLKDLCSWFNSWFSSFSLAHIFLFSTLLHSCIKNWNTFQLLNPVSIF